MAMSIANLKRTTVKHPARFMIYGPIGSGKTTLASEFPSPVIMQTEDGAGTLSLPTFGILQTYRDVMESIVALCNEQHDFSTAILDTIDGVERMVWAETARRNGWRSIEDQDFGKGYAAADAVWSEFMEYFDDLRVKRGMNTVILGHCEVTKHQPPGSEPYNRYTPRLHRRAIPIVTDDLDVLAFLSRRTEIKHTDLGFGKTSTHAVDGGGIWLSFEERPIAQAKNRYGLPAEMMLQRGLTVGMIAKSGNGVPISGLNFNA